MPQFSEMDQYVDPLQKDLPSMRENRLSLNNMLSQKVKSLTDENIRLKDASQFLFKENESLRSEGDKTPSKSSLKGVNEVLSINSGESGHETLAASKIKNHEIEDLQKASKKKDEVIEDLNQELVHTRQQTLNFNYKEKCLKIEIEKLTNINQQLLVKKQKSNESKVKVKHVGTMSDLIVTRDIETMCEVHETRDIETMCDVPETRDNETMCEVPETRDNETMCEVIKTRDIETMCEVPETRDIETMCEVPETRDNETMCEVPETRDNETMCEVPKTRDNETMCELIETKDIETMCEIIKTEVETIQDPCIIDAMVDVQKFGGAKPKTSSRNKPMKDVKANVLKSPSNHLELRKGSVYNSPRSCHFSHQSQKSSNQNKDQLEQQSKESSTKKAANIGLDQVFRTRLPEGWIVELSGSNDQPFYRNIITSECQEERPEHLTRKDIDCRVWLQQRRKMKDKEKNTNSSCDSKQLENSFSNLLIDTPTTLNMTAMERTRAWAGESRHRTLEMNKTGNSLSKLP